MVEGTEGTFFSSSEDATTGMDDVAGFVCAEAEVDAVDGFVVEACAGAVVCFGGSACVVSTGLGVTDCAVGAD